MNCIGCKYSNRQSTYYSGAIRQFNICEITNICNPKGCSITSDQDVDVMRICYNCANWIGGGDFGLSCSANYYDCNSNGFEAACEKFAWKVEN